MKKIIASVFVMIITLVGCRGTPLTDEKTPDSKISGVWITYSEIDEFLKDGEFKDRFSSVSSNLKKYNITDVFIQVHPFCNSLFKSN